MANVVMSSKPKRIRAFMINGQLYEGGAEEYYTGKSTAMGNDLGGTISPDRVAESTEEQEVNKETL